MHIVIILYHIQESQKRLMMNLFSITLLALMSITNILLMVFCKYNKINNIGKMGIKKNFTIVGTLRLDCEKLQSSWSQWKAAVKSWQNSHITVMVKFCLCHVYKKNPEKEFVLSAMHSIVKATEVELKKSIIHESYLQWSCQCLS